jgi:hypothetical protein
MSSVVSRYCKKSDYVDEWKMSEYMDETIGASVGVGKKGTPPMYQHPNFSSNYM